VTAGASCSGPVPKPDTAVVGGRIADYDRAHPTTALLVVEVADSSLKQDRPTKRTIYAAAGIPEYWIVNLPDDCVEIRRDRARGATLRERRDRPARGHDRVRRPPWRARRRGRPASVL